MSSAKDIVVKVIPSKPANDFVRKTHYSGKVVNNSKLHFGVFLNGVLHGVMSFGSPIDKRKVLPLVRGTLWNEMLELNRMAFDEALPKNSESRAIAVAMRMIRKNAPHIKWVLSFADATQCGDGAIYRASGFVLTSIKKNTQVWEAPVGHARFSRMALTDKTSTTQKALARKVVSRTALTNLGHNGALKQRRELSAEFGKDLTNLSGASMKEYAQLGFKPMDGYQIRYIYFVHPEERANLTVPILSFSEIERRGAGMYKGQKRVASIDSDASAFQADQGGASPTATLQKIKRIERASGAAGG